MIVNPKTFYSLSRTQIQLQSFKKFIINFINEIFQSRMVIKKACKMIYKKDESELLISDKTGDAYTLDMNDLENSQVKLLMGHLSVITDLKVLTDFF